VAWLAESGTVQETRGDREATSDEEGSGTSNLQDVGNEADSSEDLT
jgi:hypothetical protein